MAEPTTTKRKKTVRRTPTESLDSSFFLAPPFAALDSLCARTRGDAGIVKARARCAYISAKFGNSAYCDHGNIGLSVKVDCLLFTGIYA